MKVYTHATLRWHEYMIMWNNYVSTTFAKSIILLVVMRSLLVVANLMATCHYVNYCILSNNASTGCFALSAVKRFT